MASFGELFATFAKIGLFTFGGGYAMISMIEHECVEKREWIEHDDMINVTLMAESTPGPIAINCATFVGQRQAGLPGAAVATLGMVVPSFAIILLVMAAFNALLKNKWFKAALSGLKPCIIGVVLAVGVFMVATNALGLGAGFPPDAVAIALTVVLAAVMFGPRLAGKKISPIALIAVSAVLGATAYAIF